MTTLGKRVEISQLLKLYGALLTEKQRQALQLHYDEDLSLGEIAAQFEVSRQNVYELMTRGEALLRKYEDALGTARRESQAQQYLEQARTLAAKSGNIKEIIALIDQAQAELEGEENGI